jgi:DinB superfamily
LAPADTIAVFAEPGHKWMFVSALDWPGWARRGKTEELALATLESYLPRYAPIVARAGLAAISGTLVISERHPEPTVNADFGTLHEVAASEHRSLTAEEGGRLAALLEAEWAAFDEMADAAPEQLRKGPRGGGRDTAQIVAHVREAEAMYVRKMGLPRDSPLWRATGGGQGMARKDLAALRTWITAGLRDPASLVMPPNGWPLRYAARRIGWHVLDHLWEIEDKS